MFSGGELVCFSYLLNGEVMRAREKMMEREGEKASVRVVRGGRQIDMRKWAA